MLPTDADIAALCAAVYAYAGAPAVAWDHFDAGDDDGVCWALKRLPACDVVVFRGSTTFQDWVRDFRAAPILTRIGHVHDGFHAGMEHAWADARVLLKRPAIITGHSLGAARAAIMTGLMVKDRVPPTARVVFGEPKPGFRDLADLIAAVPGRSYRNGDGTHHDLVTDVPFFDFPPFEYVHPTPIIPVCAPPRANDRWGVFSYHHIELYQAAVTTRLVPVSV
jgi:lipase (class 3)